MRFAALASLFVSLLLACEPGVSSGSSCTRDSECAAPLVCAAGRCRVECREGRDCSFPLDCIVVNEAPRAGVCALTTDTGCAASCPLPLACVDGICRQECELAVECALDMTCSAGVCVRPVTGGSSCDPLTDEGCAAGSTCNADGTSLACTLVEERGTGEIGSTCTSDASCAPGYVCPQNAVVAEQVGRSARYCVRVCVATPESSCGPSSLCRLPSAGINGLAQVVLPPGLGTCSEPCELRTDVGCPSGESCVVGDFDATHIVSYCRPTTPATPPFMLCDASYECAAAAQCQPGLLGDDMRRCRPYCDPDDTTTCPTGSRCEQHGELTDGSPVYLCSTPP